jgi:hypothetical protein
MDVLWSVQLDGQHAYAPLPGTGGERLHEHACRPPVEQVVLGDIEWLVGETSAACPSIADGAPPATNRELTSSVSG